MLASYAPNQALRAAVRGSGPVLRTLLTAFPLP